MTSLLPVHSVEVIPVLSTSNITAKEAKYEEVTGSAVTQGGTKEMVHGLRGNRSFEPYCWDWSGREK